MSSVSEKSEKKPRQNIRIAPGSVTIKGENYKGRKLTYFKGGFATAKRRAGITRRVRPTDLRHYHITYALANGADLHDLAKRVGHKSIKMIVTVYSHLAKEVLKNEPHTLPTLKPQGGQHKEKEPENVPWAFSI